MTIAVKDVKIELGSNVDLSLRDELISNAAVILTTLRGTNPQDRAMGLNAEDIIGRTIHMAKGAYSVQTVEQIERYEPRLAVVEIKFESAGQKIIPKVVLTYNGS